MYPCKPDIFEATYDGKLVADVTTYDSQRRRLASLSPHRKTP